MAWPLVAAIAASTIANMYSANKQTQASEEAAEKEREDRLQAIASLRQQGKLTQAEYDNQIQEINDYYNNRVGLGSAEDVANYKSSIEGYDPNDYIYDFEDFNYDKTKEDFLNPYYNQIIGDAAKQAQGSAAGAGMGRSTFAAQNIARAVAQKEDELYKTALQEYNTDRSQAYTEYADAITRNQNRLNALREGTQYKMGLEGDLANDYITTQDQRQSDLLKAQQDALASKQAYDLSITGMY